MILYKYLRREHAERFISSGEVLFRSLLYFLACEDPRNDELEGRHVLAPLEGLPVNVPAGRRR